jgi:hypothetical protein
MKQIGIYEKDDNWTWQSMNDTSVGAQEFTLNEWYIGWSTRVHTQWMIHRLEHKSSQSMNDTSVGAQEFTLNEWYIGWSTRVHTLYGFWLPFWYIQTFIKQYSRDFTYVFIVYRYVLYNWNITIYHIFLINRIIKLKRGGRGGRGRDRIACSGFITTYVIIAYHQ